MIFFRWRSQRHSNVLGFLLVSFIVADYYYVILPYLGKVSPDEAVFDTHVLLCSSLNGALGLWRSWRRGGYLSSASPSPAR
jgi:hypothetical protein